MTLEEAKNIVLSLEDKYPVDTWQYNGIDIWPFIRIELFIKLSAIAIGSEGTKTRSRSYILTLILSLLKYLKSRIWDYSKNDQMDSSEVLFISDGVSFENVNGLWYEKFCDPWIDYYRHTKRRTKLLTLENSYHFPRYSKSIFIQLSLNLLIVLNLIKSKLISKKKLHLNLEQFDEFTKDELITQHKIFINHLWLQKKMSKVEFFCHYFDRILFIIKPKLVFIVSYYYDGSMALIYACKKLGIKTVDIQHGIQNEHHLSYGSWSKVPKVGFNSLPDFFNVWSEFEYKNINTWSQHCETHKAMITGNIFLEKWKDPNDKTVGVYDQLIQTRLDKSKKTILYSKSPQTESSDMRGELYTCIKNTQDKFNWLIRLHPAMRDKKREVIEELHRAGIFHFEIDLSSSYPLFSILRNIDIHITEQSSVVIEAAEFNVYSIITSRYGEEIYQNLIKKNKAIFAYNFDEIYRILKNHRNELTHYQITLKHFDFSIYNQFLK